MTEELSELVYDHLAIPRPGRIKYLQELEDHLLPTFLRMARYTWIAASTLPSTDEPSYNFLASNTENHAADLEKLNGILEEIGVHDLLRDLAVSPSRVALSAIPVNPYEITLLKAAAHPNPEAVMPELLREASVDPSLMASPSEKLDAAAQALRDVHNRIYELINSAMAGAVYPPGAPPGTTKPKRRKWFNGLGSLLSGVVLLAGNGIVIPSVAIGLGALPVVASLAGGIAAVGKGIGDLRREGE